MKNDRTLVSFADLIVSSLQSLAEEPSRGVEGTTVKGFLSLSHGDIETRRTAECTFVIPDEWRSKLPKVFCSEPWVKRNIDWHVFQDGSLCWVLCDEWYHESGLMLQSISQEECVRLCTAWMINNVRWMLYRHFVGNGQGKPYWPDGWAGWRHGEAGRNDYFRQARIKGR